MRQRLSFIALVALAGAIMVQLAIEYPKLPERVASHFDLAGVANDWMSKGAFAEFIAVMTGFLLLVFGGLALTLPKFSNWSINLPNKAHWLSAERRGETLRYVGDWLLWQGCLTLALIGAVFNAVYHANAGGTPRLDGRFALIMAVFLAVTLAHAAWSYFKFRRTPTR